MMVPLLLVMVLPAAGQDSGRIVPKPLFRDPVHDGAADPVLVWNRAAKNWTMLYTNRRANLPGLPGFAWVHGTRIGIAESTDGGATWKYTGTASIDYGKPDFSHWAPDVIDHEGVYHMYLSIVLGTYADWNADREIAHMTSSDLRNWKFESKLDLGSDRVIDATVVRLPGGTWRMWYKDERAKDGSIRYADSPDLYRWTARGNAIPRARGEGAKVFRWKDTFWMVVEEWNGIAVYRSSDCLNWTRQPENLLKEPGTIETDQSKGGHADVVVSGDRAWLFYFVHQGGKDGEGKDKDWHKRSVIQVVELEHREGTLTCDRNRPTHIDLRSR